MFTPHRNVRTSPSMRLRLLRAGLLRLALLLLILLAVRCAPALTTPAAPSQKPTSTAPPVESKPIVIGEINAMTGVMSTQGLPVHAGIQYAVDEANKKGGINGRAIQLVSRDDESKPERAAAAAEELITRENAVALVGGYVDTLVGPVSEVAEANQVPYIASASLDKRLVQRGYKFFFRLANLEGFAQAAAGAVTEAFAANNVALLHSVTPGATQTAERLRELLEANGVEVSVTEKFTPGLSDFTPLLTRVRDADAQVLISLGFTGDNVLMIRQLKEQNINIGGFLAMFGASLRAPVFKLGEAANYTSSTAIWEPELGLVTPGAEAISEEFAQGFKEAMGKEADGLTQHGYSTGLALLTAMRNVADAGKPITSQNIRDALTKIDVPTPLERVQFDPSGESMHYKIAVVQIQGDDSVVVWPPEQATGEAVFPMPTWDKRGTE
ncbi:MAG: ABC transporter substrate-binding protein [Anaerolineae bacterium]